MAGLAALTFLDLGGNRISDITALSQLKALVDLYLYGNSISDIASLSGLTALENLELEVNQISDIRPLVANPGLGAGDKINLTDNKLTQSNCPDLKALIGRGVTVYFSPQAGNVTLTCP